MVDDSDMTEDGKRTAIDEILKVKQKTGLYDIEAMTKDVPALSEAETVEVDEDYKEVQTLAQDEDLNYINETAPKSHEETYGKEAADKLNGVIDSIAADEDLYEDGFTIRKDINEGQRGTLIDKLVTARRAVLDLIETAPTQEAKEQLANFDKALRGKIQEAKAMDVQGSTQIAEQKKLDNNQNKLGTNEQTKSTVERDGDTENKTRNIEAGSSIKQIDQARTEEGGSSDKAIREKQVNSNPKKDSVALMSDEALSRRKKSLEDEVNVDGTNVEAARKAELDRINGEIEVREIAKLNRAAVRDGGFSDKRQVLNAINKYIDLDYDGDITPEMTEKLVDYYKNTTAEERKAIPSIKEQKATRESEVADTDEGVDSEEETTTEEERAKAVEDFKKDLDNIFGKGGKYAKIKTGRDSRLISDDPVLFDAMLAEVKKIFPNVDVQILKKVVSRGGLEVMGRVFDNRVELSEDKATQDTLFHELAHKFSPILSGTKLWSRGLDIVKGTEYMAMAQDAYPELSVEEQAEEALVMMIGEGALDMMEEKLGSSKFKKAVAWLKNLWNKLKYMLNKASAKDISNIMAYDLTMRNKPYTGTGLQFGEKLAKLDFNLSSKNASSVRNAAVKAKIYIDSNPEVAFNGAIDSVFDHLMGIEHSSLDTDKTFEDWKKRQQKSCQVLQGKHS